MTSTPPTDQQLSEYEELAEAATPGPWFPHEDWPGRVFAESEFNAHVARITGSNPEANERFIGAARTAVPALLAEVRRLRGVLEEIRHLHKDSPMGPCPVCIDADAAAAGGDGLVPYPCPTGRLAGAQDCNPPSFRTA